MNKNIIFFFIWLLFAILFVVQADTVWAADGTVKVQETHQTMVGFGASVAWYSNWLSQHINANELYFRIFDDLSLDILRLRNNYRYNPSGFADDEADIVSNMYGYSTTSPVILLSSWSPPASLKSNNSVNSGTLKKVDGQYVYGDFARYWVDALAAYNSLGIIPDYISIQNEPSYDASWESCYFDPAENVTWPGYNRALDSVYAALELLSSRPLILASEVHGIGYNTFQNYANQFNHNHADGYAYHLYHGGSTNNTDPDQFISNLSAIAASYGAKPIFQSEYDYGDWFNTAWLMHNCLVRGNVSGYLYWALIWDASGGNPLIGLENPWNSSGWTTENGYILRPAYWAFRQYSRYIDNGWKRVTATSTDSNLRISAFINPEGTMLTVVLLNVSASVEGQMNFNMESFAVSGGIVVRTSASEQGVEVNSDYNGGTPLDLPVRSITTVSFTGNLVDDIRSDDRVIADFFLAQNYPNPFNPVTTIDYALATASTVELKIFNLAGQEVKTVLQKKVPAGRHTVHFNAGSLGSGVYIYQLKAGEFVQAKKMILIK
jgi:glucuronoarabinoxylan endo-1,4-beta-xylanase